MSNLYESVAKIPVLILFLLELCQIDAMKRRINLNTIINNSNIIISS
jgi:hypothetical protein